MNIKMVYFKRENEMKLSLDSQFSIIKESNTEYRIPALIVNMEKGFNYYLLDLEIIDPKNQVNNEINFNRYEFYSGNLFLGFGIIVNVNDNQE